MPHEGQTQMERVSRERKMWTCVNDKQSKHLIREETVREAGMLDVTVSPDAAPSSHSGCEPVYHPDGGSADSPPPA